MDHWTLLYLALAAVTLAYGSLIWTMSRTILRIEQRLDKLERTLRKHGFPPP